MPIYEFQCPNCGGIREAIIFDGDPEVSGPPSKACGAARTVRVISAHAQARSLSRQLGRTCCGCQKSCGKPPCSAEGSCRRDQGSTRQKWTIPDLFMWERR